MSSENRTIKPGEPLSDFGWNFSSIYQNYDLLLREEARYMQYIREYRELNAENSGEDWTLPEFSGTPT